MDFYGRSYRDVKEYLGQLLDTHTEGLTADDKGISPRAGGGKVAWFTDPDGNTFAIEGDR